MMKKRFYSEFKLELLTVVPSQVLAASGATKSPINPDNINVETFDDEGFYDVSFGTEII